MKLTVCKPTEVEVVAVKCIVHVGYDDEDMPNDYPHRTSSMWDVTIDLATGQIRDWPAGVEPRRLHMKVRDDGAYAALDADGRSVAERHGDYVPRFFPGDHYGDYLILDIDAAGRITNWDAAEEDVRAAFKSVK